MESYSARTGQIIPYVLSPISPQALERLDAAVIADNVEMTGFWADPSLPVLSSSEMEAISARLLAEFQTVLAPTRHSRISAIETQNSPPAPSALPPGSICETCWDQPATRLLPAPWGGEMGSCVWCAKGEGDETNEAKSALETIGQRTGLSFAEAQEFFRRLGDVVRTFPNVTLDDLVIHPSR